MAVSDVEVAAATEADISLLAWPEEQALRQQLAWLHLPRILLVDPGQAPPTLDEHEDWVRRPADPVEVHARCAALRTRRAGTTSIHPEIDDDGLVRVGHAWVAVSEAQAPVARLLLAHLDRVVRFDAVIAVCEASGGSAHATSVRTLLARLRLRVRPVGLELLSVRRRGVLLTLCPSTTGTT